MAAENINPAMEFLGQFIPPQELAVLRDNLKGGEAGFFREMLAGLEAKIRAMPDLEAEEDLRDIPVVLHYFFAGSDWWISAFDREELLGFGLAQLGGDWDSAELGYISIPEITSLKVRGFEAELDLYWDESTIRQIMEDNRGKD